MNLRWERNLPQYHSRSIPNRSNPRVSDRLFQNLAQHRLLHGNSLRRIGSIGV